ncbi:hypothetical protein R3W88_031729 [Solanum pinnatisectum]|uniref:Retrotransposon gag domain-containing protein n=1 Tax=Solanum pinnatisectum TaxID=50273 RepID=A0AAV9LNJ1_9SOLN|nr:hypothetical protein R3W88_031729 [Solanum pinnatisectum]
MTAFLERFYPLSKMLKLRDKINNFDPMLGEAIHEVYLRFKKRVTKCLNHGLSKQVLLKNFYHALNEVNQGVVNNLAGGSFMNLSILKL